MRIYIDAHLPCGRCAISILLFLPLMLIKLCKSAFAGLAVDVGQVDSRLIHGIHHKVEGDLSAVGKEVCKAQRIDGAHCRNCVTLDAGDLHQSAHGIAGQTQMMLHLLGL